MTQKSDLAYLDLSHHLESSKDEHLNGQSSM